MNGGWLLAALGFCVLVFGAAVYLELDDAGIAARIVILAVMAAAAMLMLWAIAGDRRGE